MRELKRFLAQVQKYDLIILDELGYVPFAKAGAELLFEVVSRAYERLSLIVTTTLPFEQWTRGHGQRAADRGASQPPDPPARSLPNPNLDSLLTLKSIYKKAYRFYSGVRTGITPAFTEKALTNMSNKPKVCIGIELEDDLLARIREVCDVHVLDFPSTRANILEAVLDVEGAVGALKLVADAEFFDAAPKLRVLCTNSVGYDPYDIGEATRHGVLVCHTPRVLTGAVTDVTMSLIFSLALKLFQHASFVRSGGWSGRESPPSLGMDIRGKTLGVIGYGRIGQEVTSRMRALGMRTLWNDIFEDLPEGAPESEYRPLNDLLEESDFVSLHANLSDTSYHLIGDEELSRMKPEAFLVNTARGGLVDQPALNRALKSGQITGAGLDVLETEPPDPEDQIVGLPNVICFPHIGSATVETRRAMRELTVENLLTGLTGNMPPAPVNPGVLSG